MRTAGAAAALAVLMSVTACGPLRMGSAAIVGSQRISTSTLSGDVAALNRVYQGHPSLRREVQYSPAQMPRIVLMWLVRFRIVADIARHNGVDVTAAEAEDALAVIKARAAQQAGRSMTTAEFALLTAIPPNLAGQLGRYEATFRDLALRFTGATDLASLTPAQQQLLETRLRAEVAAALKRLNIKINPRFGQFDVNQLLIVPAKDRLSRPGTSA